MNFMKKHKHSFLFLSFIALFLFSCGGGGSNSDQVPIKTNIDQNTEVNNSSQDTVSVTPAQTPIVENRFGKCNFGECKFE
tara:strand:+ start:522 stop:761 length:240 start_codon:yes stop_codon:yes gene_type:complete